LNKPTLPPLHPPGVALAQKEAELAMVQRQLAQLSKQTSKLKELFGEQAKAFRRAPRLRHRSRRRPLAYNLLVLRHRERQPTLRDLDANAGICQARHITSHTCPC
jgi:hypothetical protein